MNENSTSFFELVADSSIFTAAFTKAKASAAEFTAQFAANSASVSASANAMGASLQRNLATGALSPTQVNSMLAQRLQFYGESAAGAGAGDRATGGGLNLGGLLGITAVLTAVLAPLGMMVDGLLKGESSFASFSAGILRSSEAIGINAQDLQTWDKIAQIAGVDQQSMTMDFERFSKNLADGATTLKATGVTLADIGITTTDAGKAILQLSDYFHTHNDQAQKAAIATALFGRSGAELIPILDQGSASFKSYEDELQKMGVILSNSDLVMGARAQVAVQNFSDAFEGAKNRLLSAALPGFTAFFQELGGLLSNNGALWTEIGTLISNDVSFIIGVIGALTGQTIDLTKPATDAAAAYQGLGGSAADASTGIANAAGATKAATDALTDQINALQNAKRAQDDLFDSQKAAYQAQLDTLTDVTDTRRRQGEDIVTYERRLQQLGLQDKIKAVDSAKTLYDRQVSDQLAALNQQKSDMSAAASAMGASLSAGIGSGMTAALGQVTSGATQINQKLVNAGKDFGNTLKLWFSDPGAALSIAAGELGQIIGSAVMRGIFKQIVADLDRIPGFAGASVIASQINALIPGMAGGGITGAPRWRANMARRSCCP
ncbi:MAG: hypothetical protein ACHQ0J_01310 [Candidatus Dormibacterales bacterium]